MVSGVGVAGEQLDVSVLVRFVRDDQLSQPVEGAVLGRRETGWTACAVSSALLHYRTPRDTRRAVVHPAPPEYSSVATTASRSALRNITDRVSDSPCHGCGQAGVWYGGVGGERAGAHNRLRPASGPPDVKDLARLAGRWRPAPSPLESRGRSVRRVGYASRPRLS